MGRTTVRVIRKQLQREGEIEKEEKERERDIFHIRNLHIKVHLFIPKTEREREWAPR